MPVIKFSLKSCFVDHKIGNIAECFTFNNIQMPNSINFPACIITKVIYTTHNTLHIITLLYYTHCTQGGYDTGQCYNTLYTIHYTLSHYYITHIVHRVVMILVNAIIHYTQYITHYHIIILHTLYTGWL